MISSVLKCCLVGACLGVVSCAGHQGSRLDPPQGFSHAESFEARSPGLKERPAVAPQGRLEDYTHYAIRNSPALQASHARWVAAVSRVGSAGKLPEPTLTYGLFVQRVETRVGPQRHRFGLRFDLPWPTKTQAESDAAASEASAARYDFEARALALHCRVSEAYWALWSLQRIREVHADHLALIQQLAAAVRGRIETGQATVVDMSQVELKVSRVLDTVAGLGALETSAGARLLSLVGAPLGDGAPVSAAPFPGVSVSESETDLRAQARQHPRVGALVMLAEARRASTRRAAASRMPDVHLGLNFIETGALEGPASPESGKDPLEAIMGLSLPIWRGAYDADESASAAELLALEHRREAVQDELEAKVVATVARIEDTARRMDFLKGTLIPQAQTAYGSAVGSYEASGGMPALLMAFEQLLELRLELVRARADHAVAWALLEGAVGRPVAGEVTP